MGLTLRPNITSDSFLSVCSHVSSGAWSSIVPHTFSLIFAGCNELALVKLINPVHTQVIGLVVSDRDPLSPLALALMKCAARLDLDAEFGPARLLLAPDRRHRLNDQFYLFAGKSHPLDSPHATAQIGFPRRPVVRRGSARSEARGQRKRPYRFSIYNQLVYRSAWASNDAPPHTQNQLWR